jgi:hypothetical protein
VLDTLPISPLSSSSSLVQSSEGSTVRENEHIQAPVPRPDTPEAPGEFEFESDDEDPERANQPGLMEEERYFFEYLNEEVICNPQTWPCLNCEYNNGYITGTHFCPHNFYLSHFLEHEWPRLPEERTPLPYVVSETDLISPEHFPIPHETREHEFEPSINNSSSSSLAGPDDPNLTTPLPTLHILPQLKSNQLFCPPK